MTTPTPRRADVLRLQLSITRCATQASRARLVRLSQLTHIPSHHHGWPTNAGITIDERQCAHSTLPLASLSSGDMPRKRRPGVRPSLWAVRQRAVGPRPYFCSTGSLPGMSWKEGVLSAMASSASFMSASMSAKSGVER